MKRWALAVALLALPGCSRDDASSGRTPRPASVTLPPTIQKEPILALTAAERENLGLKTVVASLRPVEDVRRFPGVLKAHPDRVAIVTSRSTGKIVALRANVGDRVAAAQTLLDIQSAEVDKPATDFIQAGHRYQAERAKVELDVTQAENKRRLAQADADRQRALAEKGISARKELIAAENHLQSVENDIAGLKRQLDLLSQSHDNELAGIVRQLSLLGLAADQITRLRHDRAASLLRIATPLSGVVVERPVTLGQIVDATTTLFKVLDDSIMIAGGDAFEETLPLLRLGQEVRVTTASDPNRTFRGRLTSIAPAIDTEKRTVRIAAELPNPERLLKQDMFAALHVVVNAARPVITIPTSAVVLAGGKDVVFVERPDGFLRVEITAGTRMEDFIEVKRGVNAGDRVVTDGKQELYAKFRALLSGLPPAAGRGD